MCNTIFKPFAKTLRLEEKIECIVRRHRNNYFVGWTEEQLQAVEETVRPVRCIASDEATSVISNNERLLNKKLAWVWVSEADAAVDLRDRIRGGRIRSLTAAKTEAAKIWKSDSPLYDGSRATHMPGTLNCNCIVLLYLIWEVISIKLTRETYEVNLIGTFLS